MKRLLSSYLLTGVVAIAASLLPGSFEATGAAHAQAGRELPDFSDLVDRVGPAVVNIRTTEVARGRSNLPQMPELDPNDPFYEFFRRFFPPGQMPGDSRAGRRPASRAASRRVGLTLRARKCRAASVPVSSSQRMAT